MSLFLKKLAEACKQSYAPNLTTPFLKYVRTGNAPALTTARKQLGGNRWMLYSLKDVWRFLSEPDQLADEEKRAMRAIVQLGLGELLADWLQPRLRAQGDQDAAMAAYSEAFGSGSLARVHCATALIASLGENLEGKDGQPNAAGRFLLSVSDAELAKAGDKAMTVADALGFLCRHAPQRIKSIAPSFLREGSEDYRRLSDGVCDLLLSHDAQGMETIIAAGVEREKAKGSRARVLELLAKHFPNKYETAAREINVAILNHNWFTISHNDSVESFRWLVSQYGAQILPDAAKQLSSYKSTSIVIHNLGTLADALGPTATPGMLAALKHPAGEVRLEALSRLVGWADPQQAAVIQASLEAGLAEPDVKHVVKYLVLAGRWQPQTMEPALWKLFEHKSKPVRQAAARALAKSGAGALAKAVDLLAAKKSSVRSAAVTLLAIAETPAAAKALEIRLDDETDEEVRDQILLALERVWEAQGKKISRAQIDRRIERAGDKLQTPLAKWLNEKKLPALSYAGKPAGKLPPQAVRYLCYRQSRAKEIRADVEAKPLFAMIDRKTSGDFALSVFEMFRGSAMAAEDRWALTVAGLLGDDRLVPPLMQQIRKWVDNNRGKLAEYAAQALALLGSDAALCAVDSLSIRYRSKQKNIGKAAAEAFAEAAERLGISVDELGDRVVPWLGFEPGKPRLIEEGDKRIEVQIGTDFKLEFRDLVKNKKINSLPGGISASVKNEFKDLGATLREVLKGQLLRLENLMVRQYRWPLARWREMYLVHPILFPFATRLVWGLYGGNGALKAMFRALEDRTLTNERDEPVELPVDERTATIGIVHPLEITEEQRRAWLTHLADYNVEVPFRQMERPVVFPAADERDLKVSAKFAGTDLNGLTFKSRAEKLGWHRGSVTDGGGISFYCKDFPGAGADALLSLDGMYIGIDMYTSIKLERLYFVKSGSVNFGSYVYDEPADEKDERLIAFGQVPPIVYSETLGDLEKIAGKKSAENGEE